MENCFVGLSFSVTQQSPEMLGFVPQPNLHISRFLTRVGKSPNLCKS
ncbi:hypothetical protein GXM_01278 [Nostoc sphaeroides CCNUC1]|uniref:Uncharacterized protein n=1 Tax=Nostoc sphaeroides CCNUC1 TaxID=2653204 RepID=A0A5P8VTP1_9NOSO|nr:hypothetical protein GXM_01278 [Nostoc sphaeroides CCNUC1]